MLIRFDLLGPGLWGCSVIDATDQEIYSEGPTPRAAIESAWAAVSRRVFA